MSDEMESGNGKGPEQSRKNRDELQRRIEAGEISPIPFDVNYLLYLKEMGQPLARKDLARENKAVVLTKEEFEQLESFEIVSGFLDGEIVSMDSSSASWFGPDDRLITHPGDLY